MNLLKYIIFTPVFFPLFCLAEESTDLFEMSLSQLLSLKVSIASKNDETIKNSPSSVTIFTKNDIDKMGITSWTELFSQVPGFYNMVNPVEGNQSHVVMRGHAQTYANTLLILLNGHRLNDDYTGGINYFIQFMDLADVKRVEVIRGPGSSIYGSNAFSGVINILTGPEDNITGGVGDFGAKKVLVNKSHSFGDWKLGASLSLFKDDGYHYNDVFDRNEIQSTTKDPRESSQIRAYLTHSNTKLFAQYLKTKRSDYYLFRRLRDGVNNLELEHFIFGLDQKLFNSNTTTWDFSASYQQGTRLELGSLIPQGEVPFDQADFLFGTDLKYHAVDFTLDGKYKLSEELLFNAGLSYSQSQVPDAYVRSNFDIYGDSSQLPEVVTFDQDEQRTVLDKKRKLSGAYLQTQWQISQTLQVTAGLRYDGYNDIKSALMPRFALVNNINDSQTIKFLYGQAYRAPSLGDMYDEESGLTIGSQDLKASEMNTTEFVYLHSFSQSQLTATFFSNEQTNIIGFQADENGNQALDNIAENEAHGIELEIIWQPIDSIKLVSSATHLSKNKTKLDSPSELPKSEDIAPDSLMSFSAYYQYDNWSFNINGNWRSKVKVLKSGSLWLLNSHIKNQLTKPLSLTLTVSNLLDTSYSTSSHTSIGIDENDRNVQSFPSRGRQAMLKAHYTF